MALFPTTRFPLQYIIIDGKRHSIPFTPILEELPVTSGLSHYLAVDPQTGKVYRQLGTSGGGGNGATYLNELHDVSAPLPSQGDMLVYNSGNWQKLETKFEDLSLDQNNVAIWDCGAYHLNKRLEVPSNIEFTLLLDGIVNGQMGHLILKIPEVPGADVTIMLDFFGEIPSRVLGNGEPHNLNSGIYNFCWIYDGHTFCYNIAPYDLEHFLN